MVDVSGLKLFKWKLVDRPCNCSGNETVSNFEWNVRESLTRILRVESEQFNYIFQTFPDIVFYSTSKSTHFAINKRETMGVYTSYCGHRLFNCPILVGSKMFFLLTKYNEIDYKLWYSFPWRDEESLRCLLCGYDNDMKPTTFIVKGKCYTLGLLAWTNYEKIVCLKKKGGITLFKKKPNTTITSEECPILSDFNDIKQLLGTCIGNRKIFHGGYIFTEMLKQTLYDVQKVFKLPKKNLFINQINKTQTKRVNTGTVDAIIGRNTVFNMQDCLDSSGTNPRYFNNNIGRYKVLTKLDITTYSKTLQLDILTTMYSKKISIDFKIEDLGFIDITSSSENSPGISGLESVLGTFISSESDCMPQEHIETVLREYVNLDSICLKDGLCFPNLQDWWYVIVNQTIYKHYSKEVSIEQWTDYLRKILKSSYPCVEVYHVSNRLYTIYSLPLTLYKILPDGYAYSAMEVARSERLLISIVSEDCNLHGPTSLLIFNLNCNNLVRNTMITHAIKQCVSGLAAFPYLKNERLLLQKNKYQLISGVPFYCLKANILILPLEHNIEDACVVNANSIYKKELFTTENKVTVTLHLQHVSFVKLLVEDFPVLIKPNMVFLKFKSEKIVNFGKYLSTTHDPLNKEVTNLVWNPNPDLIRTKNVYLIGIELNYDTNTDLFCDITLSYKQNGCLGTKLFILNGAQKSVIGHILKKEHIPTLHNTLSMDDIAAHDIDIIQHPFSLKRLSFNFLFTPEISALYNECFQFTPYDKLKVLESKKDYFVSDPINKSFYVDSCGQPIKAILYEGYVVIMGKQNPYSLIHSAEVDSTPTSSLTGQPEVSYQKYSNKNNHAFGLSESEREVLVALGLNSFIEEMYDLSDSTNITLENNRGETTNVPYSTSAARVLDMLSLVGVDVRFSVRNVDSI